MRELKDIIENKIINDLTKTFSCSQLKLNNVHETDSEIVRLESSTYDLAITIDTISEEIKSGLYSDPYQIGWMSVMVNISDLAAVGAVPLGIVISQIFPKEISNEFLEKLQSGINDACKKCETFVLGGDTNFGDELIIAGCAIGTVEKSRYLKRIGCKQGDKVYITGKAGIGNAYAAQKLLVNNSQTDPCHHQNDTITYLPSAKLEWRNILLNFSSSCIDTSDGVLSSLDQLMRLNNIGFTFNADWNKSIDDTSLKLFHNLNLPAWLLLAGEHGEFELLFSIPPGKEEEFISEVKQKNLMPIYVADVIEESEINLNIYNKVQKLDTEKIRNFAFEKDFTPSKYLQKLMDIDEELKEIV